MSLPTLTKTWLYNVNQTVGGTGSAHSDNTALFIAIKNALVGFGTMPWVVKGSSDGTTGAMDNVDRITSAVVNSGVTAPHTWIVLKQAGIATNFQVLFSFGTVNGYADMRDIRLAISPSVGFSGGSASADPTASDSVWINSSSGAPGASATATDCVWARFSTTNGVPYRLHVIQSNDGQCTRIIICCNNVVNIIMSFEIPRNPVSAAVNWTIPFIAACIADTSQTDVSTYAYLFNDNPHGGNSWFIGRAGATPAPMQGILTCEGFNGSTIGQQQGFVNDLTGAWPMAPIGYFVSQTTGRRGRHGTFFDMWAGSTQSTYSSYPATGGNQFVQFNSLILPWNGSIPLFA